MMRFTPTASGAKVGVHFSEAVDAKRLARFIGKHRETAFVELHTKRVDWLDAGEAAGVMHRAQDGYLAVADDKADPRARALLVEEADELIAILEGSFPEAATIVQPCVQMAAELRLNPPEFPHDARQGLWTSQAASRWGRDRRLRPGRRGREVVVGATYLADLDATRRVGARGRRPRAARRGAAV
jgi:hypothetical protein